MSNLVSYLFETNAIKICSDNNPFFLTSGKISPYFVNTHFIYGSEQDANSLLGFIDEEITKDKLELPKKVLDITLKQYENSSIYKDVINNMKEFITSNIDISQIDYISGGERRDWFFSEIIAFLLNKPHITLFKNLDTLVSTSDFSSTTIAQNLEGKNILHIADLITVASSYEKLWIPAITKLGAKILWSTVVVDRMQGGEELLAKNGIKSFAMVGINVELFNKAKELNLLSNNQYSMLINFYNNPDGSMREFLLENPNFLENALNSDEKTAKRAKLCIDENIYNL